MYLNANNVYAWAMSRKIPINGFKWVEKSKLSRFDQKFIKDYNENSDIEYFLEVDVDYPKKLLNLHKDLPFLPERKKVEFNQRAWLQPYIDMNTKKRKEAKN